MSALPRFIAQGPLKLKEENADDPAPQAQWTDMNLGLAGMIEIETIDEGSFHRQQTSIATFQDKRVVRLPGWLLTHLQILLDSRTK